MLEDGIGQIGRLGYYAYLGRCLLILIIGVDLLSDKIEKTNPALSI